jgi:hypothetical protein
MMIGKCAVAVPFLGVLMFVVETVSWAAQSHITDVVEHTQEAITHGKQGHADQLVKHAEVALMHAEAAQKEKANSHLEEGIKGLKEAISHGKQGPTDMATKVAEGALKHFLDVKDASLDKAGGGGTAKPSEESGPPRELDPSGGY